MVPSWGFYSSFVTAAKKTPELLAPMHMHIHDLQTVMWGISNKCAKSPPHHSVVRLCAFWGLDLCFLLVLALCRESGPLTTGLLTPGVGPRLCLLNFVSCECIKTDTKFTWFGNDPFAAISVSCLPFCTLSLLFWFVKSSFLSVSWCFTEFDFPIYPSLQFFKKQSHFLAYHSTTNGTFIWILKNKSI